MTWGDAQGCGKNLLGVEMWCRAGKSFWGCVFVFSTWNVTVELCCQHGYVLILAGVGGSLLRSARKGCWAMRCLWMRVHLPDLACTSSPERAGMTAFVLPPKYNEAVRAAVLKAVQRGFGCSVLIKICWENRCQNPGFDIINLPAPNESKRETWERQMSLQLTETSWYHVRFKKIILLYMSFHLCLLKNEEWLWG